MQVCAFTRQIISVRYAYKISEGVDTFFTRTNNKMGMTVINKMSQDAMQWTVVFKK